MESLIQIKEKINNMGIYLNKATLVGNLTRKPELKIVGSDTKICNFSIATNRSWKDKSGVKKEEVEFHNCVAFGRTAEVIEQWMDKGSQILVEGRLKTSSWEKEGVKHYKTEIVVESFQFGSNKPKTGSGDTSATSTPKSATEGQNDVEKGVETTTYQDENGDMQEIPF